MLIAVIAFNFRRGGDISAPYVQSVRLIAKNAVLWVMFLASMASSVFFSFDSHFNAIFSAEQRKRAAEIRTLNQVGRVVADIGERAQKVQLAEAERLFETDGWKAYDTQLAKLAQQAQGSQGEIEKYFVTKMEDRRRGIAEQQERISGAERNQTALLRRRDELEAELQRIEPGIGALEAELAKAQGTYNATRQAIAAKRIEANAEDGGVEGTLKRGKGPIFRQRMAEADELQRKLSITDDPRLREAQRQRDQASARIVSLKREIATINGDVAKYKGENPDRGPAHQGGGEFRRRRGRHQDRSGPRAAGLRARPLRLPPAAGYRTAGRAPDPVRQSSQRHAEHAGGQGAGPRHRLRSQPRRRSGRAPVRSQCRPRGFHANVCGRLQAAARTPPPTRCWASGASVCRIQDSSRRNRPTSAHGCKPST